MLTNVVQVRIDSFKPISLKVCDSPQFFFEISFKPCNKSMIEN